MGTSSARLGPTGRLWRLAKGTATRYLSPDQGGAVDAREVAARYAAALDLGESLEAGAPASSRHHRGLQEIADCINHLAETASVMAPAPATPEHWLGLPGWTWATEVLAELMLNLKNYPKPENSL
jgi:hypothetical protein